MSRVTYSYPFSRAYWRTAWSRNLLWVKVRKLLAVRYEDMMSLAFGANASSAAFMMSSRRMANVPSAPRAAISLAFLSRMPRCRSNSAAKPFLSCQQR